MIKVLNEKKEEVSTLDLGILEAGKKKEYGFFIHNDGEARATKIDVEISHDEIVVVKFPENLEAGDMGPLIIKWEPSKTVKQGLKALIRVKAIELYS